jgi:hypothetical protein
MTKLFDIGQPNQTTPAQPDAAGMLDPYTAIMESIHRSLPDLSHRLAGIYTDAILMDLADEGYHIIPADPTTPDQADAAEIDAETLITQQIDYLKAVAEYAARGNDEELQQGLNHLRDEMLCRLNRAAPAEPDRPSQAEDGPEILVRLNRVFYGKTLGFPDRLLDLCRENGLTIVLTERLTPEAGAAAGGA